MSARDAAVFTLAARAPLIARQISRYDAMSIVADYDQKLSAGIIQQSGMGLWRLAASKALEKDPLSSGALRVLAASFEDGPSAQQRTRDLLQLSERVSRRDLVAQILLIEDSVGQGDLGRALSHYDRALSVGPLASRQLYPILANAIDAAEVRAALTPYLRADRPWVRGFLEYGILNSPTPAYFASLFQQYGGAKTVPGHKYLETLLLKRLVSMGNVQLAWDRARQIGHQKSGNVDEFAFSPKTLDPDLNPFTWTTSEDVRANVTFSGERGLSVAVSPGATIVAAYRVMILRPGAWVLNQTVELPTIGQMANSSWTASCLRSNNLVRFWVQDIPLKPGIHNYQSTFTVPEDCPAVRFDLIARGSDFQEDARVDISDARLAQF